MGHRLVSDESKKSVGDELERVFFGFKLTCKILNQFGDLVCSGQAFFFLASVGKAIADLSPADTKTSNRIATDIGEIVGSSVVVTTFQQKAMRKLISYFEIDTDWSEGVGQNFLMFGM
jgi:hypothetical protein